MAAYSSLIFGAALSASFLSMGANGQTRTAGDCVSINKNQAGPIQNYQAGLLSRTGPTQGTIYSKPTVGFSDLDKINVDRNYLPGLMRVAQVVWCVSSSDKRVRSIQLVLQQTVSPGYAVILKPHGTFSDDDQCNRTILESDDDLKTLDIFYDEERITRVYFTTYNKRYAQIGHAPSIFYETIGIQQLDNGIIGLWGTLNANGDLVGLGGVLDQCEAESNIDRLRAATTGGNPKPNNSGSAVTTPKVTISKGTLSDEWQANDAEGESSWHSGFQEENSDPVTRPYSEDDRQSIFDDISSFESSISLEKQKFEMVRFSDIKLSTKNLVWFGMGAMTALCLWAIILWARHLL